VLCAGADTEDVTDDVREADVEKDDDRDDALEDCSADDDEMGIGAVREAVVCTNRDAELEAMAEEMRDRIKVGV
jgi:hypothetical protein